jgi:hypothetical protein
VNQPKNIITKYILVINDHVDINLQNRKRGLYAFKSSMYGGGHWGLDPGLPVGEREATRDGTMMNT